MTSVTDNRTTELREKLTERGVEYTTNDHLGAYETSWNGFTAMQLTPGAKLMMVLTPEQAIAATLGSGKLTAEQVQKVIYKHGINDGFVYSVLKGSFQAIADELNATLGGGECENIAQYQLVNFECSECGCTVEGGDELGANIQHGAWNHCPNCGKAVKR